MIIRQLFLLIAVPHGIVPLTHHDGFDTFATHKVGSFLSSHTGHPDYERRHYEEAFSHHQPHHGYHFYEPIFYDVRYYFYDLVTRDINVTILLSDMIFPQTSSGTRETADTFLATFLVESRG